eukprot:365737-Chlamydomonas_euryale.AAC.12
MSTAAHAALAARNGVVGNGVAQSLSGPLPWAPLATQATHVSISSLKRLMPIAILCRGGHATEALLQLHHRIAIAGLLGAAAAASACTTGSLCGSAPATARLPVPPGCWVRRPPGCGRTGRSRAAWLPPRRLRARGRQMRRPLPWMLSPACGG